MIDLSTHYLGLKLSGPVVVSSTPLSDSLDNMHRMEDAGASAIVLTSLFEEQLALESRGLDEDLSRGTESSPESLHYLPEMADYRMTHEVYLDYLSKAKKAIRIPIMASLNGTTAGGWVRFAHEMEQAGADAIELNTYALATDRSQTSRELELQLLDLVENVCRAVKIPVAVKLSQSFTSKTQGRAGWCCSTASTSRISMWKRWRCGPRCISPHPPSCCPGCTGQRSSMAGPTSISPSPAGSTPRKTC